MGSCRNARKQSMSGSGRERRHCYVQGHTKDLWSCFVDTCGTDGGRGWWRHSTVLLKHHSAA